jgi:phosphopantetheine adenylyltransferase
VWLRKLFLKGVGGTYCEHFKKGHQRLFRGCWLAGGSATFSIILESQAHQAKKSNKFLQNGYNTRKGNSHCLACSIIQLIGLLSSLDQLVGLNARKI